MKKAVIYARVSTEGQDIENSISAQIKICKEYADKNNFSVTEIFADEAKSGTSDKRPDFTSITPDFDETSAMVGTNKIYAATHQFGDPNRNIPERSFLELTDGDLDDIKNDVKYNFFDCWKFLL